MPCRQMLMGVRIHFGATVDDLDVENTQVILDDGETMAGDVIIGADGLSKALSTIIQTTID